MTLIVTVADNGVNCQFTPLSPGEKMLKVTQQS